MFLTRRVERASVVTGGLDGLVARLNDLKRSATLEFALRVGRLIVEELHGGDLGHWRRHRGQDLSFRQLAARTEVDLKMSATALYRAVALYEMCARISVELWRDFGASHLRAVLGLPEADQVRLLSRAKAENWNARQIQEQAGEARGRRPRRHEARPAQLISTLQTCAAALQTRQLSLDGCDMECVRRYLGEIRGALESLEATVAAREAGQNDAGCVFVSGAKLNRS